MGTRITLLKMGIDCCYLLVGDPQGTGRGDKKAVLVDAGRPLLGDPEDVLRKAGVPADSIALIIVTHGHWDHFSGAARLRELTGARVAVHAAERDRVESGQMVMPRGITAWGRTFHALLKPALRLIQLPPCPVDIVIDDELSLRDDYGIDGVVVHTPGHSPGSVSVVLDSGEAFVGDLAMNGPPLTLRPKLPIFAEQPELLRPTWSHLLDERQVKRIYPAHGKPFAAERMPL